MWSFRKEAHKISSIGALGVVIPCDEGLSVNGSVGVYIVDVSIGTGTGWVELTFDAINVPDRFQIIYDGNIVDDSKYVGDSLGSWTSDLLLNSPYNLPEKEYDGVQFVNNGSFENFTVGFSDIADGSAAEPTDGNGTIGFIKTAASPSTLRIKAYGVVSTTAWGATLYCPDAITNTITLGTTSVSGTWQADNLVKTGSSLMWNVAGGVFTSQPGDTPIFDFSENTGIADITIFESILISDFQVINKEVTYLDVTGNTALTSLVSNNNVITSLTTTGAVGLLSLDIADNLLASVDISSNTALTSVLCTNNVLTSLDISTNTSLTTLECEGNSLTNLVITNNTLLTTVRCDGNALVAGDIDNIVIQLDTNGLSNGTLDIPIGRTAASDTARTNLLGKSWTINEI